MADINKLKNKARREEQRENWTRAIELYKRALLESEKERDGAADLSLFNRIGDIHLRLGDKRTAVQFYEQAIQRYAEQDLHTSAIALCNKVLRILPDRVETIRRLGHLQAATGLVAEARGNYLRYAAEQMRHKRVDLALEALEECVEATADQQAGLRLAELFVELGRPAEALQRLQSLRERLAGRGTDVSRLEARIAELREGTGSGAESDAAWAAAAEEEAAPEGLASAPSEPEDRTSVGRAPESPAEPEPEVAPEPEPEMTAERGAETPAPPQLESPEQAPEPGVETPAPPQLESPEQAPAAAAPELPTELQEMVDRSRPAPEETESGAGPEESVSGGRPRAAPRSTPAPDRPESPSLSRPAGRPGGGTPVEGPERRKSTGREVPRRLAASEGDRPEPSVLSPAASAGRPASSAREPSERRGIGESQRTGPLAPAARVEQDGLEWQDARRSHESGAEGLARPSADDEASAVAVEAEPAETSPPELPWMSAPAARAEAPEGTAPPSAIDSASVADATERRARAEVRSPSRCGGAPEDAEEPLVADGETWVQRGHSARSQGDLPAAIEAFGMALGSPAHLEEALELVDACRRELDAQTVAAEETEKVEEIVVESAPAEPPADEGSELLATEHIPTIPVTGLPSARGSRPAAGPRGTREEAGDRDGAAARKESAFLEWVHAAAPALLHSTRRELEARGELGRAAIVVDRLLELEPDRLELHRARAEYSRRLGNQDGEVRAEIGLAGCLERSGMRAEAREAYERALALQPGSEAARTGLERLGGTDHEEAAAAPGVDRQEPEGQSDDGDGPEVHQAGESAEREGEPMRHEEAERPGLGKAASPGGDATAVLDTRSPLADQAPGDGPVPYDPLSGDDDAVDFEELLSELRTSLADNESVVDTRSHTEMGAELKAMGMLDEAIRELQTAVREPNAPAQAFELLGESFIEKGQGRVAARLLAKAVAERQFGDRESLGVLYQLGVAYQETGEPSKALECYERIFSIDIDFRDIKDRILDCSS